MCRVLGVSSSGFYDWIKRKSSSRDMENRGLLEQIEKSFLQSRQTYGSPRVTMDLRKVGISCSENRVARLMKKAGFKGRTRRKFIPRWSAPATRGVIAPNLLDRQFEAIRPNEKWVSDITYVWSREGWLYVAVVMDLYSRRIIGWSMHATMSSQLVLDALNMAVTHRGRPKAVVHHSDQGTQYTSDSFQSALKSAGLICSMSRRGNCWDNAAMESFFSTLKLECLYRRSFQTRSDVRAEVFSFIEGFYNSYRRHSALGYKSPVEFERQQISVRRCP